MDIGTLLALLVLAPQAPTPLPSLPNERQLTRACERGDVDACEKLGVGLMVVRDAASRALAALTRACRLGRSSACRSAASVFKSRFPPNLVGALEFSRLGCEKGNAYSCRMIVDSWWTREKEGRLGTPDDVRGALSALGKSCRAGATTACLFGANLIGDGIEDVIAPDLSEARLLSEEACRQGDVGACRTVSLPVGPPSLSQADDVQEGLIRGLLGMRKYDPEPNKDSRPMCVSVAKDREFEGIDPDRSFLERFSDTPVIEPGSWCRAHQQGDLVVIRPVHRPVEWPPKGDLEVTHVLYSWNGPASEGTTRFSLKDGKWVGRLDGHPRYPPALLALDRSADRRSMIDGLKPLVEAWNRGDEIVARVFDGFLASHDALNPVHRQYTRLDGWPQSIDFPRADAFSPPYSPAPFLRLRLVGTFAPRPGIVWPIEPWKQEGALSSVWLSLRRVDGWWRVGNWRITGIETPWWSDFRVSH